MEHTPRNEAMPLPGAPILERAEYFDAHPNIDAPPDYLENMRDRMPGAAERIALEEAAATDPSYLPMLDEPNPELGREYSSLRLSKSARAFWGDVDAAVARVYGNRQSIEELSHAMNESPNLTEERRKCLDALNRAMVPVYHELRAMGYSYYDIVS